MGNIVKELSLNKHPKDCKDLSLVNARNIMVSDDFSCLQNEQSIFVNSVIQNYIGNKRIVGYIPCNEEVVLFVIDDSVAQESYNENGYINCSIARYFEKYNEIVELTTEFHYHGGEIKGTFTYNINGELIVAVAEYGIRDEYVPLKSFNLGTLENPNIYDLKDENQSLNPIVKIPSINNFQYISGRTYKGWYHFFVRYKINDNDYTKWYHIGYPIFVCNLEKQQIFRYGFPYKTTKQFYGLTGCLDYFSTTSDIANETIRLSLDLNNDYRNDDNIIQIGFICVAKDSTKAFKTLDLNVPSNGTYDFDVLLDKCETYSVNDLIIEYYNYYNVGNVINYKNRLYISNYNENVWKINSSIVNKIKLSITDMPINCSDKYKQTIKLVTKENNNITGNVIISTEAKCNSGDLGEDSSKSRTMFINTNASFNERKKRSTLIPGEVYSFYIHFVNKYGEVTDGYKLINDYGQTKCKIFGDDNRDYIIFPLNREIFTVVNEQKVLYIDGTEEYNISSGITFTYLKDQIFSKYLYLQNIDGIKWQNLPLTSDNLHINQNDIGKFSSFVNSNGDILFKTPFYEFNQLNKLVTPYHHYVLNIKFDDGFELPKGYIGYYLSYEKFEKTIKEKGVITKFDLEGEDKKFYNSQRNTATQNLITPYEDVDIIQFYGSNVNESNLDFNALYVTKAQTSNSSDSKFLRFNDTIVYNEDNNASTRNEIDLALQDYASKLNAIEIGSKNVEYIYEITEKNILISGDYKVGHEDIGTSIGLKLYDDGTNSGKKELFVDDIETFDCYKAYCLKLTNDLYISENKTLIKFTDVVYDISNKTFRYGLNGHITIPGFLVYNWNKFLIYDGLNVIMTNKGRYYLDIQTPSNELNPIAPLRYVQIFTYDDWFNESKQFNNEPQLYLRKIVDNEGTFGDVYAKNIIPLPTDDIDRFTNKYDIQNTLHPKTYVNYIENQFIDRYDKRVRRSNIIADESKVNSWRQFPLEGYKDISENKGNITNLVGIGISLIVHTEHSLFVFNVDNTLKTIDKDVQLYIPDTFDVEYREVFASELGICGLQDDRAWIVDQFGYIFYDNDAHRIYQFGQGKITNIDTDIVQFLNKYKPKTIRFAHDKEHNRILVHMIINTRVIYPITISELTLSFNYSLMKWISFHDYRFDKAFSTKNILYLLMDTPNDVVNTTIYNILGESTVGIIDKTGFNIDYNNFQNISENLKEYEGISNLVSKYFDSRIDIICNSVYEEMKYLEFITYKLTKIQYLNDTTTDYSPTPVEEIATPYSAHSIRVFNDLVDTGILDILIDVEIAKNTSVMNYKKPWWNLGVWNFNYLRDILNSNSENDFLSRLYGNYFIISFVLHDYLEENNIGRRIEFETLNYQVTKDKRY